MKILMVNWRDIKNPRSGGAEIVTMEYAKQWIKHGHRVVWLASNYKNALHEEEIEGVEVIRKGNFLTVYFFAALYYFFSGVKFDLVIDQIHGIPFFTPLYVRVPIIAYIHEVAGEIWDYMYPFPVNVIGRYLETFYFPLYKRIPFWTNADSTVDDLVKQGIPKQNCTVITVGFSSKVLNYLPKKEKEATYIFVSRVVRMKGIEEVIKAFAFIHKEDNKAILWIIGQGEDEYIKKLKAMTKEYGIDLHVKFWGRVSEKEKLFLMKKAHVLLHASIKEGWGLVIVEAASQATPSIVYSVSGLKNSVKNGKTGIVLRSNSPYGMAKEAILLLDNKNMYKRFQLNCLGWARSLSWERSGRESLRMFKKVIV